MHIICYSKFTAEAHWYRIWILFRLNLLFTFFCRHSQILFGRYVRYVTNWLVTKKNQTFRKERTSTLYVFLLYFAFRTAIESHWNSFQKQWPSVCGLSQGKEQIEVEQLGWLFAECRATKYVRFLPVCLDRMPQYAERVNMNATNVTRCDMN